MVWRGVSEYLRVEWVLSKEAKSGRRVGRQAARIPVFNSILLWCQSATNLAGLDGQTHKLHTLKESLLKMILAESLRSIHDRKVGTYNRLSIFAKKTDRKYSLTIEAAQALFLVSLN